MFINYSGKQKEKFVFGMIYQLRQTHTIVIIIIAVVVNTITIIMLLHITIIITVIFSYRK